MTKKTIFSIIMFVALATSTFYSCSSDGGEAEASCGKVKNIGISSITPTMISFYFDNGNNANSTTVEYGVTGFTQGTGTTVITSNSYIGIENLSPGTTYDFYFTGICSATEKSETVKKKQYYNKSWRV
ncbi:hypothetical protein [Flavobacterium sp.]|uniref:hypothetical protein n=1 Tax=Flavobacterium sp. TaxID=239 RepID=UPI0028BEE7B5|nr:hypothetical protein [Flavobacterium sp.]